MPSTYLRRTLLILLPVLHVSSSDTLGLQQDRDELILRRAYHLAGVVRERVFPLESDGYLTVRTWKDLKGEPLDFYFSLRLRSGQCSGETCSIDATIKEAVDIKLETQLWEILSADPGVSLDEILSKLEIGAWEVDEGSCPALVQIDRSFRKQQVPAELRALSGKIVLHVHAQVIEIRSLADGNETAYRLTSKKHVLWPWAQQETRLLRECIPTPP